MLGSEAARLALRQNHTRGRSQVKRKRFVLQMNDISYVNFSPSHLACATSLSNIRSKSISTLLS
jgi:hypothetical protein